MPAPEDSALASQDQAAAIETAAAEPAAQEAPAVAEEPAPQAEAAPAPEAQPEPVAAPAEAPEPAKTEPAIAELTPGEAAAINQMTEEFLRWPLPESVSVDLIALEKGPGRSGTNLLSVVEAKAMLVDVVLPHLRQRGEPIPSALAGNVDIKVLEPALGLLVLALVNKVASLRAEAVDFWGNGNHAGHTLATEKAELLNGIIEKLIAL